MLKYALLGFLNYLDATGYDLKQLLDVSTANFWHAEQSQIYATLKKLENENLISSKIVPQENRPDRRVYSITEKGKQDLINWLNEPIGELEERKETLLLKLFFSAGSEIETLLTELHLQKSLHEKQLELYQTSSREIIAQFRNSTGLEEDARHWELTRRFGEMFEEMYIAWLEEAIQTMEGKSG